MRALPALERALDEPPAGEGVGAARERLLRIAEETLEAWIGARGGEPTMQRREGFRLLALHHQGARETPSFNACRETCREIAYHYLLAGEAPEASRTMAMMSLLVRHLVLFVAAKMRTEGVGEFCCASRPLRAPEANMAEEAKAGETNA